MKKDIRDLFKEERDSDKSLPINHREEFIKKLNDNDLVYKSTNHPWLYLKVAAVVLVMLSLGFLMTKDNAKMEIADRDNLIKEQILNVEEEYLAKIDNEWKNFLELATDERLINKYRTQLEQLDHDYKEIAQDYAKDSDNILIIEALVDNLQTRLRLLKEIQEHLRLLNHNIKGNENKI